MGWGQAAGGFVEGMRAAGKDQREQEKIDLASQQAEDVNKFRAKQMATMDYNLESAKKADQEKYSPEAKRLRAEQRNVETMKLQMEQDLFSSQGASSDNTAALQNEVVELKQKTTDMESQTKTSNTVNNMMETFGSGGRTTDLKPFNQLIEDNPALKTVYKNPVQFYNPNDPAHTTGLRKAAEKSLGLQMDLSKLDPQVKEQALGAQGEYLKELANRGRMVMDSQTGEMYPVDSAFNMLGASKHVSQTKKDNYAKTQQVVNEQTSQKYLSKVQSQTRLQKGNASTGKLQYQNQDAEALEKKYNYLGKTMPQELKEILKHNAKIQTEPAIATNPLLEGRNQSQLKDFTDNVIEASAVGDVPQEYFSSARTAVDKGYKDEKQRTQKYKELDFAEDSQTSRKIFENIDEPRNQQEVRWMKQTEGSNLRAGGPDSSLLQDTKAEVDENLNSAKRINGILGDMKEYAENDSLLTGLFAETAISKFAQDDAYVKKVAELKVGDDSAAAIKEADKIRTTIKNTINVNTQVGMELAKFIKEMSGAAVSEEERTFLSGVMAAITQGDPAYVGTALQAFRDVRLRNNAQYADDDFYQTTLPDTMYEAKKATNLSVDFEIPHTTSVVSQVGEAVTNRSQNSEGPIAQTKGYVDTAKEYGNTALDVAKGVGQGLTGAEFWGRK